MGGKWEDEAAVVSVAAESGSFFSNVVPLHGPVRPVLMIVPLGMSHQPGCSEPQRRSRLFSSQTRSGALQK